MIHYLGEWFNTYYQKHEFYGYDDETDEICFIFPAHTFNYYVRSSVKSIENVAYCCAAKKACDLLLKAVDDGRIIRKRIAKKKSVEELENECSLI